MPREKKQERFEELMAQLEAIVKSIESEELDLEQSIQAFEKGVSIGRECHRRLDEAERKVERLRRLPTGEVGSDPFRPDEEA